MDRPGARCIRAMPLLLLFSSCGTASKSLSEALAALEPEPAPVDVAVLEAELLESLDYLGNGVIPNGDALEITVDLPDLAYQGVAAIYATRYGIPEELALTIVESAVAEGIDPDLGFRLVQVESRFNPNARGPRGALGLTQLMPGTARSIDRSLRTDAQILHPPTNLRLGFRYLRDKIERYDGDVRLGLLAYNRGPIAVDRAIREGRDPENGYSRRVLGSSGSSVYTGSGLVSF
jgi:hypothetical protein